MLLSGRERERKGEKEGERVRNRRGGATAAAMLLSGFASTLN
jgi:hypothetical protein